MSNRCIYNTPPYAETFISHIELDIWLARWYDNKWHDKLAPQRNKWHNKSTRFH